MPKLLALLLFLPALSFAQKSPFDQYLGAEHKVANFNGSVLVAKHGAVIYQKALGYRDPDYKQLLNPQSVFELASISKQFTATGILQLKEAGKLKLSDTLRQYFPELPYNGITIEMLLTHNSGLPAYEDEMEKSWDRHKIAFNQDMISFLAAQKPPLHFKPGTKFEYSNTGYAILASILEKVSGQTYADYLAQHIFTPLKMTSSRVYNTRRSVHDTIANYAYGFAFDKESGKNLMADSIKANDFVYYLDGIVGDGTVNANTGDLLKWQNALNNHTLLNAADQEAMLSPHSLMDTAAKTSYGYGVMLGHDKTVGDFITHSGGWPGYVNNLAYFKTDDLTIVVLSNNESNSPSISTALAYLVMGKPIVMPYVHKPAKVDPKILAGFVGKYASPRVIEVVMRDGKLYRHLPGAADKNDVELIPESNHKVYYNDHSDRQLVFETDANGKVSRCWVVNYGVRAELKIL